MAASAAALLALLLLSIAQGAASRGACDALAAIGRCDAMLHNAGDCGACVDQAAALPAAFSLALCFWPALDAGLLRDALCLRADVYGLNTTCIALPDGYGGEGSLLLNRLPDHMVAVSEYNDTACEGELALQPAALVIGDSTLLGNVSSPLRSLRIYDDCHLEETLAVSCVLNNATCDHPALQDARACPDTCTLVGDADICLAPAAPVVTIPRRSRSDAVMGTLLFLIPIVYLSAAAAVMTFTNKRRRSKHYRAQIQLQINDELRPYLLPEDALAPTKTHCALPGYMRGAIQVASGGEMPVGVLQMTRTSSVESDSTERKALLDYANLLRLTSHPNVLALHGVHFTSIHSYICTDVTTMSLYTYLRQERPVFNNDTSLGVLELMDICTHVTAGLAHLHERLILHTGVRTEHVYVTANGQIKVAPLQTSVQLKHKHDHTDFFEPETRAVCWCAPEVLQDSMAFLHSDVYSLGVTLWEIMSYSRRPWPTSSKDDIARQCVRGQLELEKPKLCPMRLHRVIEKCCAMAPASRPKPVQVLAAIEDLLDELSTSPDSDALYLQEGIRLAPSHTATPEGPVVLLDQVADVNRRASMNGRPARRRRSSFPDAGSTAPPPALQTKMSRSSFLLLGTDAVHKTGSAHQQALLQHSDVVV